MWFVCLGHLRLVDYLSVDYILQGNRSFCGLFVLGASLQVEMWRACSYILYEYVGCVLSTTSIGTMCSDNKHQSDNSQSSSSAK